MKKDLNGACARDKPENRGTESELEPNRPYVPAGFFETVFIPVKTT